MNIAIIIVIGHPENTVFECLQSLENSLLECQKASSTKFSIHLVFNYQNTQRSFCFAQKLKKQFPLIKTYITSQLTPAAARNLALENNLDTDYLCFLDDDTILPLDYFDQYLKTIKQRPLIEIIGGPDQVPTFSSKKEEIIGKSLKNPMITGVTSFRHSLDKRSIHNERTLILCNLWIKTEVLKCNNLKFLDQFKRGEENILLEQLKNMGASFYSSPELFIYHRKNHSFFILYKKVFLSGLYRAKSMIHYPQMFSFYFFLPTLFTLYMLAIYFLIQFSLWTLLPSTIYLCLSIYFLRKEFINDFKVAITIFWIQISVHLSYGTGFFWGIFQQAFWELNYGFKSSRLSCDVSSISNDESPSTSKRS